MADGQREYKDRLFCFLFGSEQHRDWTLSLYNAVNGSQHTDAAQIEITTMRDVLYLGMRNDVSFMICDEMNLYEQQSTFNPNMPLRMLEYAVNLLSRYVENQRRSVYSRRLIHLPTPRLVVFYNGGADRPDEQTLRLSDAFDAEKRHLSDIEAAVRMINVNAGHSPALMSACPPLYEYAWVVRYVRRREEKGALETAIDGALDDMPKDFVIKPFLETHRAEVKGMLVKEFNWEKEKELLRQEYREEYIEEGRESIIIYMLKKNMLPEQIAEMTGVDIEEVERLARAVSGGEQ